MKFCEAMESLKSGNKVTRSSWNTGAYFLMDENKVNYYQPVYDIFSYDEEIMVSTGWLLDSHLTEYSFSEIVPFLAKGYKARRKAWNQDMFIFYDPTSKSLAVKLMQILPFIPDFISFMAEDWIVLDNGNEK
jgi:hypothetical protein